MRFSNMKMCFELFLDVVPKLYAALDAFKNELAACYRPFFDEPYTDEEFSAFCKFFGVTGYPPLFSGNVDEPQELYFKLAVMREMLIKKQPAEVVLTLHSFMSSLLWHLEATRKREMLGLDLVTTSIATKGKELEELPVVTSLLESYRAVCNNVANYPIIIFDQSEGAFLEKNRRYLERLEASFVHVSAHDALKVATKLGIEPLINTTKTGQFGFGGARNCQYLLTGIFKACFLQKKCAQDLGKSELFSLFTKHVLETDETLFLVDDDMELSRTALFSTALFATLYRTKYYSISGYQYGLDTKTVFGDASKQPLWSNLPLPSGISQYATKPKICLNLPHGCEENHLMIPCKAHFYLQPARHLGTLQQEGRVENELLIGMVSELLDPTNSRNRCVLVWNEGYVASLKEALSLMAADVTKAELKRRFLENVRGFLANSEPSLYYDRLKSIKSDDLAHFWHLIEQVAYSKNDKELGEALDAAATTSYPVTRGFYLLARAIAQGEFCDIINAFYEDILV